MACGDAGWLYFFRNASTKALVLSFHALFGRPTISVTRYWPASPTFFQNVGSTAGPPEFAMPVRAVGAKPRVCAWLIIGYAPASLYAVIRKSYGGEWFLNRSIWAVNSVMLGSAPTTSYFTPCLSRTGNSTSRALWPPSVFS